MQRYLERSSRNNLERRSTRILEEAPGGISEKVLRLIPARVPVGTSEEIPVGISEGILEAIPKVET